MTARPVSTLTAAEQVAARQRHRSAQFRAVIRRTPFGVSGTLITLVAALWRFGSIAPQSELLAVSGLLGALEAGLIALTVWWRRGAHTVASAAGCWGMGLAIGAVALAEAWLVRVCLVNADVAGRIQIIATAAGFLSFGAWLLAPLRHTGLAWALVLPLGLVGALASVDMQLYAGLIVLTLAYAVLLVSTTLFTEREFLHRLQAADALAAHHELVGLLLHDFEQDASDWLWELDAAGRLRRLPQRLVGVLGAESAVRDGLTLVQLLERITPPGDAGPARLAALLVGRAAFKQQVFAVQIDGQQRWWSLTARPLHDVDGRCQGWRGVGSDVTAIQERDRLLSRQASEDQLTGLANRHRFLAALDALQGKQSLALVMLDLDNFKRVNDSLGHAAGDRLLVQVARRLESVAPPGALLARLGGDEFAFVLPGVAERHGVQALSAAVMQALAGRFEVDQRELVVEVSLGAAFQPADAQDTVALQRAADLALYAAKGQGRGRLCCFESRMRLDAERTATLLSDLRVALREAQFELYYQPQVSLSSGALVGFEALVRWRHPLRGLVPPVQFIPLAEESGLIVPLGRWVLREACREAAGWNVPLRVAVNVAAQELERSALVDQVGEALRETGLTPERLELELTESSLLHDTAKAIALLKGLQALGLRVALDDFGTGFSSLAYLRAFPLDKLKIDRSFVRPLDVPAEALSAAAIVRHVEGLAGALGLGTVAEGVETDAQASMLRELGVDVVQGYWLAPPLPAAQARQFIATVQADGLGAARAAFGLAKGLPLPADAPATGRTPLAPPAGVVASRWAGL